MEQNYYLAGFLDVTDVTPYFVYLIFKGSKDGQLYFIGGSSLLSKITELVPISESCYPYVVWLEEYLSEDTNIYVSKDDDFMFGFKTSDGELIISDYVNMRDFLKSYAVDNSEVQHAIYDFITAKE